MRPNAFTVAPGGLGDALIRAAGLVNVSAEIGRDRLGQVPSKRRRWRTRT